MELDILRIDVERGHGTTTLALRGDFDHYSSPALIDAVSTECARGNALTVDLTAVTFIDGGGISALMSAVRRCEEAAVELAVTGHPPMLLRLLEIVRDDRDPHSGSDHHGAPLPCEVHSPVVAGKPLLAWTN